MPDREAPLENRIAALKTPVVFLEFKEEIDNQLRKDFGDRIVEAIEKQDFDEFHRLFAARKESQVFGALRLLKLRLQQLFPTYQEAMISAVKSGLHSEEIDRFMSLWCERVEEV